MGISLFSRTILSHSLWQKIFTFLKDEQFFSIFHYCFLINSQSKQHLKTLGSKFFSSPLEDAESCLSLL